MIFDITPIIDINSDFDPSHSTTHTKKTGFVLETDNFGHESVSVYRVINKKDAFNSGSEAGGGNNVPSRNSRYMISASAFLSAAYFFASLNSAPNVSLLSI